MVEIMASCVLALFLVYIMTKANECGTNPQYEEWLKENGEDDK